MKTFPLAGLRAFEAAARQENFRQAGVELGMTAAAVSQHVRALEDWLGVALFERHARGVKLTSAGRDFGQAVTSGLGQIGAAADKIRENSKRPVVRLACLPSVVSHWLAPRLDGFYTAHPEISVSISYAGHARSPAEANADLLIQHGNLPEGDAQVILNAETRPTCSPAYLARKGPISTPEALLGADLLHDETATAWEKWFTESGLFVKRLAGPIFADFNLLLGSLAAGHGVALCPTALIAREIEEKRLVVLFDRATDADKVYWMQENEKLSPEAVLMRDWILAQAAENKTV
ncbi:LysR substrate-binding domain-containing protein [Neorhizobium alkalisoli]|uniref:HTH-type transcriptional regulator TtuA n=1 Tax=Neorhizobium alkalisoli TaxID=528178 RepID=A0A561QHM1_9HYPH|nr:LysR substrate-binding domain-containing protein [Neorhizobium alkalisoli]TWF49858.1 LysR family transcriptional regulator [Neorhizobium alkalisoli]